MDTYQYTEQTEKKKSSAGAEVPDKQGQIWLISRQVRQSMTSEQERSLYNGLHLIQYLQPRNRARPIPQWLLHLPPHGTLSQMK